MTGYITPEGRVGAALANRGRDAYVQYADGRGEWLDRATLTPCARPRWAPPEDGPKRPGELSKPQAFVIGAAMLGAIWLFVVGPPQGPTIESEARALREEAITPQELDALNRRLDACVRGGGRVTECVRQRDRELRAVSDQSMTGVP